jgi:Rrf2 family transcriptional regulator, cysteine metabolism repressor
MATQIEPARDRRRSRSEPTQRDRGSLMNVGRRVEYACRALCYMAGQPPGRVVPRAEIESHQAVPTHFLSKILRALVGAGILESAPGVHGGFCLTRPPGEITFRDVFEAIEGRLSLTECVRRGEDSCGFMAVCTQRGIWLGAQQALLDYLQRVSIAEIADTRGLVPRAKQVRLSRGVLAPKPV